MSSLPNIYPNSIGDEAVDDFQQVIHRYGNADDALDVYLHALALMFKPVDDIARDGPNGEPGWSQIFDLGRAKTEWLPWAGQMVGYRVPIQPATQTLAQYDAAQRQRIVSKSAYNRGTVSRLIGDLQDQLNPPQRVVVTERYGGDPYTIKVWVYQSEIRTSAAEITKAAQLQKDAGLLMEFSILTSDNSYDTVRANNATYQASLTRYTLYDTMYTAP